MNVFFCHNMSTRDNRLIRQTTDELTFNQKIKEQKQQKYRTQNIEKAKQTNKQTSTWCHFSICIYKKI